jgi:hypothetical protein
LPRRTEEFEDNQHRGSNGGRDGNESNNNDDHQSDDGGRDDNESNKNEDDQLHHHSVVLFE